MKKNKKYPIYHWGIKQGTEEWLNCRKGKLSASNAQAIAANGKGLETYIYKLLTEKYSQNTEHYTNADIERGVELEPIARDTYTIETGNEVEEVGFVEMDQYVLASPDGLVGKDGGIEIKCVNDVNFFKLLVDGERAIESKYLWQCQMFLFVTGRKWIDLVFYNPNFDKNLLIFRVEPEVAKQEKLMVGIEKGKKLILEISKKYKY
jgi:putative phage-type endonuclease